MEFTNVFGESGKITDDFVRHSHIYIGTTNDLPITIQGLRISGAGFGHPYRLIHSQNVVLHGAYIIGLTSDNELKLDEDTDYYAKYYYGDFEGQPNKAGLKNSFVMAPIARRVKLEGFAQPNVTIIGA